MANVKSGKASFMAVNMIVDDDASIAATSQADGTTTKPQKEGSGAAGAFLNSVFTGTNDLNYVIQIETTGSIGVATFKWSNDNGATFPHTGVATSTSPVSLENGITVFWTQGAGDDVVADDIWRFNGYSPYHRRKMLDRERDTEWRSSGTSAQTLTFDFGSAKQPQALVVMDHNFSASASIVLQGSSNNFGSIAISYAVPWQSGSLLYFLGEPLQTLRYWRLTISDPAPVTTYFRISEIFLGGYTRLNRTFDLGDLRGKTRAGQRDRLLSGKFFGAVNTVLNVFDLSWVRLDQVDRDSLVSVFDSLNDLTNREVLPVFFSPMDTDLSRVYLCEWSDQQIVASSETDAPERYTVPVRLIEQPRTLATS